MIEPLAVSRLPVASAFSERPVVVSPPSAEAPLFEEGGVRVTSERLVARGRSLPLADIQRVESVRRSPRMLPVLVTLAVAMSVGLPALSALPMVGTAAGGIREAALVAVALVIFGCIARLVLAEDSYQVVVHTAAGPWRVLSHREPGAGAKLVTLLHEVSTLARNRR